MRRALLSLIVLGLWPTLALAQTTTQVVEYYHTDALGSVRAVTKKVSGQWQVVSRHDFMPFGEEVAPQNPPPDKRLFTGKERDAETGLDYFSARSLNALLGRFTTTDPLMSSGHPNDPQSWTRYTYARNNPLRFSDPFGLFVWRDSGCTAGDAKCEGRHARNQQAFRNALNELAKLRDSLSSGSAEYARLEGILKAYGAEGAANGVNISFGKISGGWAGQVGVGKSSGFLMADDRTVVPNLNVTLDPDSAVNAVDVGHEGIHVGQYQTAYPAVFGIDLNLESATNLTKYQSEREAHLGSIMLAGLRGDPYSPGGHQLFKMSWGPAERVTAQTTGLDALLRDKYGVTPQNPGSRLYEVKK